MEPATPLLNIRRSLHALAQPLAAVTGMVDLLLLEMDEQDELFDEIKLISEQLEKMLQIIEEMRRVARGAPGVEAAEILDVTSLSQSS